MKLTTMSVNTFLNELPAMIENGYKGHPCICISEHFLKKLRKELRRRKSIELSDIYIFCCGYVLDPNLENPYGLYLQDCGNYYEILMLNLHPPMDDLLMVAMVADMINEDVEDMQTLLSEEMASKIHATQNRVKDKQSQKKALDEISADFRNKFNELDSEKVDLNKVLINFKNSMRTDYSQKIFVSEGWGKKVLFL